MGSISLCAALDRYIAKHGKEREEEYSSLIGRKVVEFLGTEVNYHIKGYVRLDDGTELETHYRWSSEKEDARGIELDPDYIPMAEYYKKIL